MATKKEQADDLYSYLRSSGVLQDLRPEEACVVVAPTDRIKSSTFMGLLQQNGLPVRLLAFGTGKVRLPSGKISTVPGTAVAAINTGALKRLEMYARLFGVSVAVVERRFQTGGPRQR